LRLSASEAVRQSARCHEPPSPQPDLPQPGPRQGRPAAHPPNPPRAETAKPGTADRSRPRSWRTECRRRRTEGTGASRDRGHPGPRWVRAASETAGPRWAPAVTAGVPESQVTQHSPLRPWPANQRGAGVRIPPSRTPSIHPPTPERAPVSRGGPLGYHHAGDQGQPVYIGGCPWPDPARAPPSKAVAGGARLSGAAGGGSALPWQGPLTRGAAAPASGRAWSTFGPHAIGAERFPTVSSGRSFAQVASPILGKRARGLNPDKDEVPGSSPPRPTKWPLSSGNIASLRVRAEGDRPATTQRFPCSRSGSDPGSRVCTPDGRLITGLTS
jgi:hypothetical protein